MDELDITLITKRSIKGVFALVSRTFTIQSISFLANFLLTIFLSPTTFGVFFVVSAAIAFLTYFSDIGLAAALIQKKEKITGDDLKTTFTIQQILVLSLVIVALLVSSRIGAFYKLDQSGVLLFQALAISFFLSSLKTIPSIILERGLRFEKLLTFGFPFQLNSVLALVKDDLFVAYLGKALPLSEVGFIGFAQKWAFMP